MSVWITNLCRNIASPLQTCSQRWQNPKRLMILCTLVDTEVPVGVLASQVGLSQSALSQHLSKLRAQRLVKTRRDAQTIYYSSNSESVKKILASLEEIYCQVQKSSKTAAA